MPSVAVLKMRVAPGSSPVSITSRQTGPRIGASESHFVHANCHFVHCPFAQGPGMMMRAGVVKKFCMVVLSRYEEPSESNNLI